MEAGARCRDTALGCARRRPMIVVGLGEHHRPRAIEGALPGHILCVRNVETPSGSARAFGGERSADREESSTPRREQDDQEANAGRRKAAGNRDEPISALLLMVADNRPDIGPGVQARKRADVVR
jgi:hypothetical protein